MKAVFTCLFLSACSIAAAADQAPRPPQAPPIDERLQALEDRVSAIESKLGMSPPKAGPAAPTQPSQQFKLGASRQPTLVWSAPEVRGLQDHTHTCKNCGTRWGGAGHSHNCPNCGTFENVQDPQVGSSSFVAGSSATTYQYSSGSASAVYNSMRSGCANGNCGTASFGQPQRGGGLFGFGVLGRNR